MCRQDTQLFYEGILEDYNGTFQTWDNAEFVYIQHFLGKEYSDKIHKMEEDARSLKIRRMQMVIQEALEFQRRELGQKLAIAQREFMIGLENEVEELDHLLYISRAFIYSYFTIVNS